MKARLRQFLSDLRDAFWLLPASMVLAAIVIGITLVRVDQRGIVPKSVIDSAWLYSGGGTGARTLLGAVASSAIGVAGTVFSITIAALSLAAGQMGPRLLKSFTRDRGNQVTLGAFLGTFAYSLIVLRSVRTEGEGQFTPHVSLSFGLFLAFVCVGMLVFFVGHMAGRINVDTVIDLVSIDVRAAMHRLTTEELQTEAPPAPAHLEEFEIRDPRHGYLRELDADGLADWALRSSTTIRLLVRPGDYVFPGAPIAHVVPMVEGAAEAIVDATALGPWRASGADIENPIRQLVEVAVRALSPGINDPHTALSVLDRLGAALCEVATKKLPNGVWVRAGRVVMVMPTVDYDGLTDTMFHLIRQNASTSATVLIRMLEVIRSIMSCERDPIRLTALERHADMVMGDAEKSISTPEDLADIRARRAACSTTKGIQGRARRARAVPIEEPPSR